MKRSDQNGQSVVEFALVLPLLLILVLGITEFGLVLYDKAVITNASREGARAGIVATNARTVATIKSLAETVATSYCTGHLITFSSSTPTVVATPDGALGFSPTTGVGNKVTVTVTYEYHWLVLPGFLGLPNPLTMTAVSVMDLE
jgi:Flp pilus assembly protein TadG